MLDVMIGTILALMAAVVAVFLILIAINVAFFFKLRSVIPPSSAGQPAGRTAPVARQ
jgi:hypothetical protein